MGFYGELPYNYVLLAVNQAEKLVKREAHLAERPIAQLTSIIYNVNRGKKAKAVAASDLYQYASAEDKNLPAGRFGRAMQKAIEEDVFPSWALFVYKELNEAASGVCPGEFVACSDDVCVLAPEVDGHVLTGLVIAQESASNKVCHLQSPSGAVYTIKMPKVHTKFVADETWELELLSVSQPPIPAT